MIFERILEPYIIHVDTPIADTVKKISDTKGRILFGIDHHGCLKGALTNGDLVNWLVSCGTGSVKLNQPVHRILNPNFHAASVEDSTEKIKLLLEKFLFVPIIDSQGHLKAVARRRSLGDEVLHIEGKRISNTDPVYVIAEVGNNHNGSIERARRLITAAKEAGADCVKFQMRDMDTLYQQQGNDPESKENLGSQYTLDLLSRFQLSTSELFDAFDHCKSLDITPMCTPWDEKSVSMLEEYGIGAYKVSSADLTNHDLIKRLIETGKPLILSTGMSTDMEIKQTVEILQNSGTSYALLHCNSTYPPPFKDINLNYLSRLKKISQTIIGYSGHERDIFVSIGAAALGARIIEKHFTEDRSLEGNDHKVSLLPDEFSRMVTGLRQIDAAIGDGAGERSLSQGEMMNRVTLAKSVYINSDLKKGELIQRSMLVVKSPGHGLQPNQKEALVGKLSRRDMIAGDVFYPADIEDENVAIPRHFTFRRPWGIPVRYHDFEKLIKHTNVDLLEFHLSYKDTEIDIDKIFQKPIDTQLVVHSPELFAGDHTLDLCSPDQEYRHHSIKELQRVINITKKLASYFNNKDDIGIITNVGGFSENGPLHGQEKQLRMDYLFKSLKELDTEGVEIWPQTMPPFPWHFGGQRYHNLFVDVEDIITFSEKTGNKICLDISHSKLACNHKNLSFTAFIQKIGKYVAHLHIADADGLDGEGLQITDGDIDFLSLANTLEEWAPLASMIPEIWQGHENEGEGFWKALSELEKYNF